MVGADDVLLRVDIIARRILIIEIPETADNVAATAIFRVKLVIGIGVIGVITERIGWTIHIGAGIGQIEIADLALNGQRRLPELVFAHVLLEAIDLQVAKLGIEEEHAVRLHVLVHKGRSCGPIVGQINLERRASAKDGLVIGILLFEPGIGDCDVGNGVGINVVSTAAEDIVDEASVMFVKGNSAKSDSIAQRNVDHAFHLAANATFGDTVDFTIDATGRYAQVGLVGDDADGTRFA